MAGICPVKKGRTIAKVRNIAIKAMFFVFDLFMKDSGAPDKARGALPASGAR